jgi:DNA-binding NarL/FixJ family response regulator
MIRVLLVDDQELVRTGLRGILRDSFGFEIVGECADGGEVPAAVEALGPDVIVMDARMPGVDGVRATREVRARDGSPPVLALTTFDDDEVLAGMLRAGAAGFVLKGVPAEDLQRAVRVVADGGAWLDPAVTARVLAMYRSAAPPAARQNPQSIRADLDALTSREREVLVLIGHGRTNGEIAAALFVSEGTVKTHINHLFTKLRLRDRAAAVVFAFDHDLVTRELGPRALHAARRSRLPSVSFSGQHRLGLHLHQPCRLEESGHDHQGRRGPDRPEYLTMRACDLSPVIGARQEHPRSYNVPESGSRLRERLADKVKAHPRLLVGPTRRRGSICWHRRGPRDDNTVADTDRAGEAESLLVRRVPANQLTFHAAIVPPAG